MNTGLGVDVGPRPGVTCPGTDVIAPVPSGVAVTVIVTSTVRCRNGVNDAAARLVGADTLPPGENREPIIKPANNRPPINRNTSRMIKSLWAGLSAGLFSMTKFNALQGSKLILSICPGCSISRRIFNLFKFTSLHQQKLFQIHPGLQNQPNA